MKDTDLAYIAGFVDGEASISLYVAKNTIKPYITEQVQIANTYLSVLEMIQAEFGGNILEMRHNQRMNSDYKRCWVLRLRAQKARTLLIAIQPYLRVKASQAQVVLGIIKGASLTPKERHSENGQWKRSLSDAEIELNLKSVQQIRILNRRGKIQPMNLPFIM